MVQLCPRCQRANPRQAAFCHFDGCLLRQGAAGAVGQMLQEFVFPSGRRCKTFDELASGCYYEWEDARTLLREGTFASFLAGIGRADLAKSAREAQGQADADIALTNFVSALPATGVQGPKLGLNPRRLIVGPMRVGEQRAGRVAVLNEGRGLLQGKVTVAEGVTWIKLVDGSDDRTFPLKTGKEQVIGFTTDTTGLTVGQNYSGKLVVVTNGGVAELPIRLDLIPRPFPRQPYQGASDPRDLARKMRDNPHPGVALLESGEVARWFASNGWSYPIAGATAPGLAAVQQYFEELGLAKAPQIVISEQEMRFRCTPPEVASASVTIRSPARKLVYGRAESDSPWLKVTTPGVSGQVQAQVGFDIDTTLMDEDRTYVGTLKVIANAGQAFTVRVQVDVQGNRRTWFGSRKGAPVAEAAPPPAAPAPAQSGDGAPAPAWLTSTAAQTMTAQAPATMTAPAPVVLPAPAQQPAAAPTPRPAGASFGRMVLVGALAGLLWRLALVFPADVYARLLGSAARSPAPGTLQAWLEVPGADGGFLRLFVLATWWLGALAGVVLVWRRGGNWADLVCGALAGAFGGLGVSATAACGMVLLDEMPRQVLRELPGQHHLGAAVATPLWIVTAAVCWLLVGAVLGGVLGVFGQAGRAVLGVLAGPFEWLLRVLGLGKLADFFVLRGE
jgi:hypothetical protein